MCASLGTHGPANTRHTGGVGHGRVRSETILEMTAIHRRNMPQHLHAVRAVAVLVCYECLKVVAKRNRHCVTLVAASMRGIMCRGAGFALEAEGEVLVQFDDVCNDSLAALDL